MPVNREVNRRAKFTGSLSRTAPEVDDVVARPHVLTRQIGEATNREPAWR